MPHYKVAVIGSSGGGSATITSGETIIDSIQSHFLMNIKYPTRDKFAIKFAILITSEMGFDFISDDSKAKLYVEKNHESKVEEGKLSDMNGILLDEDAKLAAMITRGDIDALIAVSSDPEGVNKQSIEAAIAKEIPIVGTGGRSISAISLKGGNVIGCSGGSVATTGVSKSISFAASLASHWGFKYKLPPTNWNRILKVQSFVGATLPILIISALSKTFLNLLISYGLFPQLRNEMNILAAGIGNMILTTVSMVACAESSGLAELGMLSGAASGSILLSLESQHKSIMIAIFNGLICGQLHSRFFAVCAKASYLPTASSIISTGCAAIFAGVISLIVQNAFASAWVVFITTFAAQFEILSDLLLNNTIKLTAGGLLGYLTSWGSEKGYYHSIMLPLIAIEMQNGDLSILGAFDFVCLCMPCAGCCGAVYLLSLLDRIAGNGDQKHGRLGWKGLISNIFFGDFVEACYPYSLDNILILCSIRTASVIAGAILLSGYVKSTAYIPLPLTLLLNWFTQRKSFEYFMVALCTAFFLPFLATFFTCYEHKHVTATSSAEGAVYSTAPTADEGGVYHAVKGAIVLARTSLEMKSFYDCKILEVKKDHVVIKWLVHQTEAKIPKRENYFQTLQTKRPRTPIKKSN